MRAEPAWRVTPGGVSRRVRVMPRGGRDALDGFRDSQDEVAYRKVQVRAAAANEAADEAARRGFTQACNRSPSALMLEGGATARIMTFAVRGEPALLADRLERLVAAEGASP